MTPEERAERAIKTVELEDALQALPLFRDGLIAEIARAIRGAVEAEGQACYKLAADEHALQAQERNVGGALAATKIMNGILDRLKGQQS